VHICHRNDTCNRMISGFRREVDEKCVLLCCYAASSGNFFTDVSGQHTGYIFRGQELKKILTMEPTGCPETSALNYHYSSCNDPEERGSHVEQQSLSHPKSDVHKTTFAHDHFSTEGWSCLRGFVRDCHSVSYADDRLADCDAVSCGSELTTFRREKRHSC
jgi:hypothetical protein